MLCSGFEPGAAGWCTTELWPSALLTFWYKTESFNIYHFLGWPKVISVVGPRSGILQSLHACSQQLRLDIWWKISTKSKNSFLLERCDFRLWKCRKLRFCKSGKFTLVWNVPFLFSNHALTKLRISVHFYQYGAISLTYCQASLVKLLGINPWSIIDDHQSLYYKGISYMLGIFHNKKVKI